MSNPDAFVVGLPFTPTSEYKPDPDGRLRRMKSEDWPAFRIMIGGLSTPIAVADTLDELLEAGRQWSEHLKQPRPESEADRAHFEDLRGDASALDRLHRANRRPVVETDGTRLDELNEGALLNMAEAPGSALAGGGRLGLAIQREIGVRIHDANGISDHEPPDGPDDSPDPEIQ